MGEELYHSIWSDFCEALVQLKYKEFFVCFCFLGLHWRHMEAPRLGGELEL